MPVGMGDSEEKNTSSTAHKKDESEGTLQNGPSSSDTHDHDPWASKITKEIKVIKTSTFGPLLKADTAVSSYAVKRCFKQDPMVYLLVDALKSHGCTFTSADVFTGIFADEDYGFHHDSKQMAIQKRSVFNANYKNCDPCVQIRRGLIRAFDDCRASNFNPMSISHQACTEIRAANLTDCDKKASFTSGFYGMTHKDCVKVSAMYALRRRGLPKEKTTRAIEKVFDRCYNDLEPVGRVPRDGSVDQHMCLYEGIYYGYSDFKM